MASPFVQKRSRLELDSSEAKRTRRPFGLVSGASVAQPQSMGWGEAPGVFSFGSGFGFGGGAGTGAGGAPAPCSAAACAAPAVGSAVDFLGALPGQHKRPAMFTHDEEGELQAGKRSRNPTREDADLDVPRYTQRHFDFLVAQKHAESEKQRQEYEARLGHRERELGEVRASAAAQAAQAHDAHAQCARMSEESRLLKRAVSIQDQKIKALERQVADMQRVMMETQQRLHQEQQVSYALRVHVAQFGATRGGGGDPGAPDVY